MITVGTDIVHTERLKGIKDPQRFLHRSEIQDGDSDHLAGIIAVKEAFFKALGTKPSWLEVEVKYRQGGQPYLTFSSRLESEVQSCSCSISHDGKYAVATVVLGIRV